MDQRFTLALKYYDAGLLTEAWESVRPAAEDPKAALEVLSLAAALCLDRQDYATAERVADTILARDKVHLGGLLYKAQVLFKRAPTSTTAKAALAAAMAAKGSAPAAWNNLGNALDEAGYPQEACTAFERALTDAPDFSPAHNNLGATLAGQGLVAAAARAYRKALQHDPKNLAALNNLGVALLEQGLVREALGTFGKVLAADPDNRSAADNRLYAAIYIEEDPGALFAAHTLWGRAQPHAPSSRVIQRQRLRVGYVSPDFRHHSVSFFIEPLIAAHDASRVEVFCYADVAKADAVTQRIKTVAHHWRDIKDLSDAEVLQKIRHDEIDVLVDLAGHTNGNRLAVFAQRAAPVQVTAIGYPGTTGLPAMDYRLCDAITDPAPGADAVMSERLIRLPRGFHCYAPLPSAPPVGPLPAAKAGHVTFGSFNKLAKISPATVRLWALVLKSVARSRLVIKTKPLAEAETRKRLADQFAGEGISADRLELLGWVPGDESHLALYNRVDIALDTSPYNGTTTTCEALWMGVPVITLAGLGHASRVSASILTQVGLTDWIGTTPTAFVAIAEKSARDITGLSSLRASLRARVAQSPLCDSAMYAHAVEDAYQAMWRAAATTGSSAG